MYLVCSLYLASWLCFPPQPVICPTISEKIIAIASENNFPVATAIRIAKCESQLGKYKKNWEGSSATGLYQFMPTTWKENCKGDINNDTDQINCFIKLYPKHRSWWQCK